MASEPHLQEQAPLTPQPPCLFTTTSGYLPLILALTISPPFQDFTLPPSLYHQGPPTHLSRFSFHDEGRLRQTGGQAFAGLRD